MSTNRTLSPTLDEFRAQAAHDPDAWDKFAPGFQRAMFEVACDRIDQLDQSNMALADRLAEQDDELAELRAQALPRLRSTKRVKGLITVEGQEALFG